MFQVPGAGRSGRVRGALCGHRRDGEKDFQSPIASFSAALLKTVGIVHVGFSGQPFQLGEKRGPLLLQAWMLARGHLRPLFGLSLQLRDAEARATAPWGVHRLRSRWRLLLLFADAIGREH